MRPIRLTSSIGDRFPASCTARGRVPFASLDPAVLADRFRGMTTLPALGPRSLTSVSELLADLELVEEWAWSMDDELTTIGVTCFALPVGHPHQPAGFGVTVTVLSSWLGGDVQHAGLIRELRTVADGMTSPLTPQ